MREPVTPVAVRMHREMHAGTLLALSIFPSYPVWDPSLRDGDSHVQIGICSSLTLPGNSPSGVIPKRFQIQTS